MGKVSSSITPSLDGYVVGPDDRPGGLGVGGERLHYCVVGGPWSYADHGRDTAGFPGAPIVLSHRTGDQPDPGARRTPRT